MTKKLLIIFIILLLLPTEFSLAENFTQQDVPDPLAQYQIKDEARGILQKITGEWEKINNWGVGFWSKNIEPYFGKYINRVEQNIKQGWAEEKQEYRQNFFKTLGAAWEKIKNFILHK